MASPRAGRTKLSCWLIRDVVELYGLPEQQGRQAALHIVREVREDLRRAAAALGADRELGVAARCLVARLSWALGRLGDPEEYRGRARPERRWLA